MIHDDWRRSADLSPSACSKLKIWFQCNEGDQTNLERKTFTGSTILSGRLMLNMLKRSIFTGSEKRVMFIQ